MNRNEEFNVLMAELENTPSELEYTVSRAEAKQKKSRCRRAVFTPLGSIAAIFIAFALTVNLSPNFAQAVSEIPILSKLAEFVSLSPSLSAAVDNDYVQQIGQEQTENGITARVEYIIADRKQLNIFYSLDTELYSDIAAHTEIKSTNDAQLHGYFVSSGYYPDMENGTLRQATVDFSSGKMPESFILALNVFFIEQSDENAPSRPSEEESKQEDTWPEYISQLKFPIAIDLSRIAEGEIIELNQELALDGQKIILKSAEIYPIHMRLNFEASGDNSAWLTDLSFYISNDKNEIFNGVGGYESSDRPMMRTYLFESPYFSSSKSLSLHITAASWLDKETKTIRIDLVNKTADFLPEGVVFESCHRDGDGWLLSFSAPERGDRMANWVWGWDYCDAEGGRNRFRGMGSGSGSTQIMELENYPYDEVWLKPKYTSRFEYDEPVVIEIKNS